MKIYVCYMTFGKYDEAYTEPVIAWYDEEQAKQWVARKDEGLIKMWDLKDHYIKNVPQADHYLYHHIPPRNKHEEQVIKDFYEEQRKICAEFEVNEDESDPRYTETELK